jgi:hypothetical protein
MCTVWYELGQYRQVRGIIHIHQLAIRYDGHLSEQENRLIF